MLSCKYIHMRILYVIQRIPKLPFFPYYVYLQIFSLFFSLLTINLKPPCQLSLSEETGEQFTNIITT